MFGNMSVGNMMSGVGNMRTSGVMGNLSTVAGLLSGNAKAQLIAESGGGLPVVFTINPSSVKIVKHNKVEGERGVIVHETQDAIKATGNIRLVLNDAHVTGVGVTQSAANTLIKWATPIETPPGMASLGGSIDSALGRVGDALTPGGGGFRQSVKRGMNSVGGRLGLTGGAANPTSYTKTPADTSAESKVYGLPVLLFSWGLHGPRGSNIPVTLEKVEVEYKRFDPLGLPIWAKFSLTLVEVHKENGGTNPTSGGVPGRSTHTVQQGENVVQIANRVYGSPRAWRAVAEANDLDDPLRVKPGRPLSLPPGRAR